jgi:hypothetical protein
LGARGGTCFWSEQLTGRAWVSQAGCAFPELWLDRTSSSLLRRRYHPLIFYKKCTCTCAGRSLDALNAPHRVECPGLITEYHLQASEIVPRNLVFQIRSRYSFPSLYPPFLPAPNDTTATLNNWETFAGCETADSVGFSGHVGSGRSRPRWSRPQRSRPQRRPRPFTAVCTYSALLALISRFFFFFTSINIFCFPTDS